MPRKKARKKRRKASGTTIRRGSCRVVRGAVRICMSRGGKLTVSATGPRKRRRKTTRKKARKSGKRRVTRKAGKKLKKPKMCKGKPTLRKGVCRCRLKSGKMKKLRTIKYCRALKRGGKKRRR